MDFVASVIVTARREPPERIARLLSAVGGQDVEGDLELVVAVEPSEAAELRSLAVLEPIGRVRRVTIVDNPGGGRSSGLNRAAAAAAAEVVCRLDARSLPAPDHVRRCVHRLARDPSVGVVGGTQMPISPGRSLGARGVARALANPWLLGAPAYRRADRSGPVDTVYLGSFRRKELVELGGYDERLGANEDFELAQRYRRAGFVVWLEAGLQVGYETRATIGEVFGQYEAFGRSKVRYWRLRGQAPNARQAVALALGVFVLAIVAASVRRPRRLLGLVLCSLGGVAAVDHAGDPHEKELAVRGSSILASCAVVSGWLAGIIVEAGATVLRPAPARARAERDDGPGSPR